MDGGARCRVRSRPGCLRALTQQGASLEYYPLLQQFELAVQRKYARNEDRILFSVADTTKAILTFLEGAPVLSRKAGDWA